MADFDFEHGGWGGPPRFPQPAVIELLLRRTRVVSDDQVLRAAVRALDVMADGGIQDQIGGGFHRYATDTDWLVPHFEKMLYDNAQLARVYLHAYQLTGEPRFRAVAETTLDYLAREMRTTEGLFAASQDADTDGIEGRTYVWTLDEVTTVLGGTAAGPADDPRIEPVPRDSIPVSPRCLPRRTASPPPGTGRGGRSSPVWQATSRSRPFSGDPCRRSPAT